MEPTDTELRDMVNEVDSDQDGSIDFQEFLAMMSKTWGQENTEEEIRQAFKIFDKNGDGFISADELRLENNCFVLWLQLLLCSGK